MSLRYRSLGSAEEVPATPSNESLNSVNDEEVKSMIESMTLTETLLLASISDGRGFAGSLLEDCLSPTLRLSLIVDLAALLPIRLDPSTNASRFFRGSVCPLSERHLVIEAGEIIRKRDGQSIAMSRLLQEIYENISSSRHSLTTWISVLNGKPKHLYFRVGETAWNPFQSSRQVRQVRERVAKALFDRGLAASTASTTDIRSLLQLAFPLSDFGRRVKQSVARAYIAPVLLRRTLMSSDDGDVRWKLLCLFVHNAGTLPALLTRTLGWPEASASASIRALRHRAALDYANADSLFHGGAFSSELQQAAVELLLRWDILRSLGLGK